MDTIQQHRREEGEILHVYPDQYGFWTIGVGIMVDERKGGALLPEESDFILRNRVRIATEKLTADYPWFTCLNEPRQSALLNMAHQLGFAGLAGFPKMLGALADGRWAEAETHALDSLWAKQTTARAKRMARQLATGEWQ